MTAIDITLRLNGEAVTRAAEPRTHLADFLREEHLLTGTHLGCEQGVCGACTLFVDGRPVRACITLAAACQEAEVRSVEGFEADPLMQRLREAFTRHHGLQCGFCTPGMLATAYDIVRRLPDADAARIRRELSGNLCRCTGYAGIVAAIQDVLAGDPPPPSVVPLARASRPQASARTPVDGPATDLATAAAGGAVPAGGFDSFAAAGDLESGIELIRSLLLAAPVTQVWPLLCDVPAVVACIPGAALDGPPAGDIVQGRCTVAVGPMQAAFRGSAALRYDQAAQTGRLVGEGRDRLSRSRLEGALDFALAAAGSGQSRLDLRMVYRLSGPLAQFGRPALVREIADRLLADTAAALAARATGGAGATAPQRPIGGLRLLAASLAGLMTRILRRG